MSFPVDADSVLPVPVVIDTKHALNLSSSQLWKGIFWNLSHLSNSLHCTSDPVYRLSRRPWPLHPKARISSDEQISDVLDYGGADLQIRNLVLVAKHAGHTGTLPLAPAPVLGVRPYDPLMLPNF